MLEKKRIDVETTEGLQSIRIQEVKAFIPYEDGTLIEMMDGKNIKTIHRYERDTKEGIEEINKFRRITKYNPRDIPSLTTLLKYSKLPVRS